MTQYNFSQNAGLDSPAIKAVAVTKSDSTNLTFGGQLPRALYVGGAGDLAVKVGDDITAVTLVAVPAGSIVPVCAKNVMSTNTTATNIVALY